MKTFIQYLLEIFDKNLHERQFKDIPWDTFKKIVDADPTTRGTEVGKYALYVLQWYKKGKFKDFSQLSTIYDNFEIADKKLSIIKKSHPDIKSIADFKEPDDLNNKVMEAEKQRVSTKGEAKKLGRELSPNEYEEIYDDDNWKVIIPITYNASVYFGKRMCAGPWCVSRPESRQHFDSYGASGDMYLFIYKPDIEKGQKAESIAEKDEINHRYYVPSNNEFASFLNKNEFSKIPEFKRKFPELNGVFQKIDAEYKKEQNNTDYFLKKRFERFKKSPAIEYIIPSLIKGNKEQIMMFINHAKQVGIDVRNDQALIGHDLDMHGNANPKKAYLLNIYLSRRD